MLSVNLLLKVLRGGLSGSPIHLFPFFGAPFSGLLCRERSGCDLGGKSHNYQHSVRLKKMCLAPWSSAQGWRCSVGCKLILFTVGGVGKDSWCLRLKLVVFALASACWLGEGQLFYLGNLLIVPSWLRKELECCFAQEVSVVGCASLSHG